MKRKSKAAREPAALWLRRKEAFDRLCEPIMQARQPYRDAVSMRRGDSSAWGRAAGSATSGSSSPLDRHHGVNWSYRYMRWLSAQGMGERPYIKTSRDASPDEIVGEMADVLMGRVLDEGRAFHEWRQTYADKCWMGCSTVWYGYHARIVDAEDVADAAEDPGQAVERALSGDTAARPGQDHKLMAEALRAPARDPEAGADLGAAGRAALFEAAQSQDQAGVEALDDVRDVQVVDRQVWFRREVVGEGTFWDPAACDPSDWEWMAQKVVMRVDEARNHPGLGPGRKRLQGTANNHSGKNGDGPNTAVTTSGLEDVDDETKRVTLYIFWDKRFRTRHIISPELPDEYLENDESNPYVDDQGEDLIPGFFPCAYSAPELPPLEGPERCFGVPLVAPGWVAEEDADNFRRMMVMDANKHARRDYILNTSVVKDPDSVTNALRGPSGAIIPVDVEPGMEDKILFPVQFRGSSGEIEGQLMAAKVAWSEAMAMPHAELSSRPQASTATQEEIGVAAGRNEAEDVIKQDERAFASLVMGMRGLIRGLYSDEKIAALLGAKFLQPDQQTGVSPWELWNNSALDGDLVEVKFGTRVLREDAVRIKQVQAAIEIAQQYTGPMGLPILDMRPMFNELFRNLGMGAPQEVAPAEMQMRQLVDTLVQEIEQLKQEAAEAHAEGKREAQQKQAGAGKPGPDGKTKSQGKAPKRDTMNSGARRGTSSA